MINTDSYGMSKISFCFIVINHDNTIKCDYSKNTFVFRTYPKTTKIAYIQHYNRINRAVAKSWTYILHIVVNLNLQPIILLLIAVDEIII